MTTALPATVWEGFSRITAASPQKLALIFLSRKWTYQELKDEAERFAAGLYSLGVRKGDRAIIYMTNIPQWLIAFLALHRLEAFPVAVAPVYTPTDLTYMANDSGAETLICLDTNFGYAMETREQTKIKRVIVTTTVQMLPWWRRVVGKSFERVPEGRYQLGDGVFSFSRLMRGGNATPPPCQGRAEDVAVLLYTGGTTGMPKGVPYTNASFLENALIHRSMSFSAVPPGEATVLQGGPLYHNLGFTVAMVCLTLTGETLILTPRVNLDAYLHMIQRYRITNFFGVPMLFRMILDHDRLDYYDLSSLKYIFTGGDVLPAETVSHWQARFKQRLWEAYGITETCGGVGVSPPDIGVPVGSCGRVSPSKEVMFVDPDTLEPVPKGEPGEILVHSEHMVRSYWNKPEESRECFVEINGKVWYRTRDIMRLDENGWLWFMDRSADLIKHKGYRVAASEVERALQEHPAVTACSVVGIPDKGAGERIKAFVVLRSDVRGITSYDLLTWCRERLAPYKVPQYIEFRDMLPKSKVGKVLRRELRAEERKKLEA